MNVTFEDKDRNVVDGVHNYMRDVDANEVKRAVNSKLDADKVGNPGGVAPLGPDGKIPGQYFQEDEDAHDIPIDPHGDLTATNVRDAIYELEDEKQPRLGYVPESVGNKASNLIDSASVTKYPAVKAVVDGDNATLQAAKTYTDSVNTNVLRFRGYWDVGSGTPVFPATGGTGPSGAVAAGDTWEQTPTRSGYDNGDLLVAKIATPGQTAANWGKTAHNTTQATELARGTAMLATQAEIQDNSTPNDIDIVTPLKFWQGLTRFLTQAWTFALKITFTTAPRFSSVSINQYLKVDTNKDLVGVTAIPGGDVAAATDSARGSVELATGSETKIGTDTDRAVTPASLSARIDTLQVLGFSSDVVATSPVVLSGAGQVIQGKPVVADMVAVVTAQANPLENGIYKVVHPGAWLKIGVWNDETYNYKGNFEGLRIFNKTDKKFYNQISTAAEIGTTGQNWTAAGGGSGGGGGDVFTADIPVTLSGGKTFGKWVNGQTIPANGKSVVQVITEAAMEYLEPLFTAFGITGQATSIEAGESIASGSKTFTWGTSNSANVATNSVVIRNQTAGVDLATGLANDGSEAVSIGGSPIQLVGETSQVFRVSASKANWGVGSITRDLAISSFFAIFYGPVASAPANSAAVRAMTKRLRNAGNVWQLNTGTTQNVFAFWLPDGRTLVSVKDVDALNLDITASYATSSMNVNDAAGTARSGTLYVMTATVPYSTNHRHEITIS